VAVFERAVRRFFEIARHPVLGVPYTRARHQPMRELNAGELRLGACATGSFVTDEDNSSRGIAHSIPEAAGGDAGSRLWLMATSPTAS
jgi:hypothetical protein